MLRSLLSSSRLHLQAAISLISLLSCSATLWLTLSFCWQLWPPEKRPLAVLIGVVWELAKLIFMTQGLHQTCGHTLPQRFGGVLLIVVSLLASAGSVGASAGYMQQRRATDQQRIVTSSRQYNSARVAITALDEHIAVLTDTARRQSAQNFLTRAQKTSDAITDLRGQRQRAAAALESLEGNAVAHNSAASPPTAAGLLHNGAVPPALLHIFVSVMLEMFGFAAMLLLHGDVSTTRAPPRPPQRGGKISAPNIYKPTQLTQARLTTLHRSRRYRACRDFLHAFGQHCLRIGRDDGMLTTAEIRMDLCEGMDWRTVRGYLRLLTKAGVLSAPDKTRIGIADFANSKDCAVKKASRFAPQLSLLPFRPSCI